MIDILLTDQPLSVEKCKEKVTTPESGGIALFVGTVRNQTKGKTVVRLEFEAYGPMAVKEMRKIGEAVQEQWGAHHIAIHHREGILGIGEIAVVIAVSCAHRKAAFAGCAYAIDSLKETVPIWKKEIFEDGAVWVAAHP